jgi:hypothetical protein
MKSVIFFSVILCLSVFAATGCKKSGKLTAKTTVDSLELHREGGFVGFSDHFRITPSLVRKGRYDNNNTIVFDSVLSAAKHAEVKSFLNAVPSDMVSNNTQVIQQGNDITYQHIVSYKGGVAYTYHLNYNEQSAFVADMQAAITELSTP